MNTILSHIIHNPISLVILCLAGIFLLFKLIQRLYRYLKRQKQVFKRMGKFLKLFLVKNPFKDEFRIFKRQLPWRLRKNIKFNQHYCIFSIAKNEIASQYSQISHFRKQYYPYYKEKQNIRFDLDSQYFIYNIDCALILEQDRLVDKQFDRLIHKLVNYQLPTVILALDLQKLMEFDKEAIELLAQSIRRKIRALMEVKKVKLPIFLHIQGLDKFSEKDVLADYMQSYGKNLYTILNGDEQNSITLLVDKIKLHYVEILEKCENGMQATKVLYGLKKIVEYLSELQSFIDLIEYNDGLAITPKIKGIFLNTFNNKEINILSCTHRNSKNPYIKRNIFLSVFSALVVVFFVFQAVKAEKVIKHASQRISKDINIEENNNDAIENLIVKDNSNYKQEMTDMAANHVFSHSILNHQYYKILANKIYNNLIFQKLKKSNDETQVLYLLAIIHATTGSQLAKYIKSNSELFSLVTGLKVNEVNNYLQGNFSARTVNFVGARITNSVGEMPRLNYKEVIEELRIVLNNKNISVDDYNQFYLRIDKQFIQQIVSNQLVINYLPKIKHSLTQAEKNFIVSIKNNFRSIPDDNLKEINRLIDILSPLHLVCANDIYNISQYNDALAKIFHENDDNVKLLTEDKNSQDHMPSSYDLKKLLMQVEVNAVNQKFSNFIQKFMDNDQQERQTPENLLYNKNYVDKVLLPATININKLQNYFKKYNIDNSPTKIMLSSYLQAYSKGYIAYYQRMINSYVNPTTSLTNLQLSLDALKDSNSSFISLINTIDENTSFSKESVKLDKLNEITNYFLSWHKLKHSSEKSNQKSSNNINILQSYLTLMQQLAESLSADGDVKQQNNFLIEQTKAILKNSKDSYKNEVENLLNKVNMPIDMRSPFMYLFDDLVKYGGTAIHNNIMLIWSRNLQLMFDKISNSYPIMISAKHSLSVKNLSELLVPIKGKYWQTLNSKLGDYLSYKNGVWKTREKAYDMIFPATLLEKIQLLQAVANKLWTTDGKPKSIVFKITTLPLYIYKIKGHYLRSANLVSGNEIIPEVNGTDYSQSFNYAWWKDNQQSSVGVTLGNDQEYSISKTGEWSLYKLMALADKHKNKFIWKLLIDRHHVPVSFNINESS